MVEAIVKYPKPKEYLTLVKLILSQSHHVKTLILTPFQHQAEWMSLLAGLAQNLQELEELTITAICQKNIEDSNQPVGADQEMVETMAATGQIGNQEQPWENVIDFQCMPNSLNANQFLTASARDQTIELARQVNFMVSPFKDAFQ